MVRRAWTVRAADPNLVQSLARQLHLTSPVAQVLVARGLDNPQKAYAFLHPSTAQLHDPFLFVQMPAAMERLQVARERREKVLIYGDYDTDGITATALLTSVLRSLDFHVDYFIPDRLQDGYGLSSARLEQAKARGISLVVTVDCGTTEIQPVKRALELDLDLIITDHHVVQKERPPAPVLLNAQLPDSGYPDKNLCGVGIAYKMARALVQHLGGEPEGVDRYLDLVALGTVADVVPLVGENRSLVREGLRQLRGTERAGLQALIEVSQSVQDRLGVRQVAFHLAPRLNALGRLGDATAAVQLLTTENKQEAQEIAGLLNEVNSDRQRLQQSVLEDIQRRATGEPELFEGPVIVLSHPEWHRGLIGIVASKLVDRYYRPTLLCAVEGEQAHGSARSIPGFHITDALAECSDLLDRFGGHELAAGVTLPVHNLPALQERLGAILTGRLSEEDLIPRLTIDAEMRLDDMSEELVEQLAQLGPFGEGNPRPVLAAHGLSAGDTARIVGNGSLKFMVAQGNTLLDAIAFRQGHRLDSIDLSRLDVAFHPEINEWQGQRRLQLNVVDLRTSEGPTPVREPSSRTTDSALSAGPLHKVTGKAPQDCCKAFDQKRGGRSGVVVVDDAQLLETLGTLCPDARERLTQSGPSEWKLEALPDAVLLLCGRRGPDHTRRLIAELRQHCPAAELYLGVADSEMEEIQRTLRELYPDRERLLGLYQKLKDTFGNKDFQLEDAVKSLRGCSRAHVASCLRVFEELDLVERRSEQDRLCLRRVRTRRDLLMSPTFRQGQALRERWTAWLQALQGSAEDAARFLNP